MAQVLAWKEGVNGKVRLAALPVDETQQDRARRLRMLFAGGANGSVVAAVVDDGDLPGGNGEMRAAWDIVNGAVVLSLPRARAAVRAKIAAWGAGELPIWRGRRLAAQIASDSAGVTAADAAIADWIAMPADPAIEAAANVPALRTILHVARDKRTGEAET